MGKEDKEDKGKKDKEGKNGRWRCPTCKVEADIKDRKIQVYILGGQSWPLHYDCEFAQDIDHIDFSKLERIG